MSKRIFYFEGSDGGFEQWLEMEEHGSLTYTNVAQSLRLPERCKGGVHQVIGH
jgi:hypothetical protein